MQAEAWGGFNTAAGRPNSPPVTDYEEGAGLVGFIALSAVAGDPSTAQILLDQTFVLSLAELATSAPIVVSAFDPDTGAGSVDVPDDIEPGLYAVAGTCIFPDVTQASYDAAVAAVAAQMEADLGPFDAATFNAAILAHAETYGPVLIEAIATPQDGAGPWIATFTVVAPLPALDPMTEAFCAVLLEFAGLEAVTTEALAVIPADDGSATDEEWAAGSDWDSIEATLRELGTTLSRLLDAGDESRVAAVADDWATVTDQVRDLLNALEAVDYDLSTPVGRQIAGQLTAAGDGGGDGDADSAVDEATASLTSFAVATCFPAAPAAPAASPTAAQPTFTG